MLNEWLALLLWRAELSPASRERGWERPKIEDQCFLDNVCFCLTLRFGKDGCFIWTTHFSSLQPINWVEIISSLLYNLWSVFFCCCLIIYTYIFTCIHTYTHACTCTHGKGFNSANLYLQIGICFLSSRQSRFPHVWIQKANWVGNSSWETFSPLTYSGTSSLLFYYFCPSEFCSYNVKIIHLFSCAFPIQIGLHV